MDGDSSVGRSASPVLLISYQFPPVAGIGGKRIAKFAKFLARAGYRVHVVTARLGGAASGSWDRDVRDPNITIHRIPARSPFYHFFRKKFPPTLWGQARRAFRRPLYSLFRVLYQQDQAQFWGSALVPFCEKLIAREGIVNVVATGGPFMVNHHATRLKDRAPHINLINDFRDSWTDMGRDKCELGFLHHKTVQVETGIVNHGDTIVAVTDSILEELRAKCRNPKTRFETIPNGIDPDDLQAFTEPVRLDKFRILHAGTFSEDRRVCLLTFLRGAAQALASRPALGEDMELAFAGDSPRTALGGDFPELPEGLCVDLGFVAPHEALREMRRSAMVLVFQGPQCAAMAPSKVFDTLSVRRHVFTISSEGETADLVRRLSCGPWCRFDDEEAVAARILEMHERWMEEPELEMRVPMEKLSEFLFPRLVERLAGLFAAGEGSGGRSHAP